MTIFSILRHVNFKTLYFNFTYFPFRVAIQLPVWVSRRCVLSRCHGNVSITAPIRAGMIRLGFEDIGIFDRWRSRSIWRVSGQVVFQGDARIGHGCKVNVGLQGSLVLGENFYMPAESTIICHHHMLVKKDCGVSWDVLIIDSDMHHIYDSAGIVINPPAPVVIGEKTWVGCRTTILKGVNLPDHTIVAADSLVTRSFENSHQLIGGHPACVLKENVYWDRAFLHQPPPASAVRAF